MAIAYVQSAGNAGTSVAFGAGNTAGNLLVFAYGGGGAVTGLSDTRGNTWTRAVWQTDAGISLAAEIWYAMNCAAGANTVTRTGGFGSFEYLMVAEYSGLALSSALDKTASANYGGLLGNPPTSGATSTTVEADELLIGVISNDSTRSVTWDSPWVERQDGLGNSRGGSLAEQVVSSTGAYTASGVLSGAAGWQALIATFKAAGGGGGAARPPTLMLLGCG